MEKLKKVFREKDTEGRKYRNWTFRFQIVSEYSLASLDMS